MKLLDLFCGAGGAGEGYRRAGFDVTGIDINPQTHYRAGHFIQADALDYLAHHGHEFDAVHASPPCQPHSGLRGLNQAQGHDTDWSSLDLIAETRALLEAFALPYVIENVPGAPLVAPIVLDGSMFSLGVWKRRLFETSWPITQPVSGGMVLVTEHPAYSLVFGANSGPQKHWRGSRRTEDWQIAMDIHWMTRAELAQAIPPAYTEWIGNQMIAYQSNPVDYAARYVQIAMVF